MAIIDELGLEVKILVNGSAATEYTPDEETQIDGDNFTPSTKTCCRYVESIDDAQFAIYARVEPGTKPEGKWIEGSEASGFTVELAFDGGATVDRFMLNRRYKTSTREGITSEAGDSVRRFRFASLSTVECANKQCIARDLETAKNMGLVRVVFRRIIFLGKQPRTSPPYTAPVFAPGDFSLAEQAFKGKAISHGTTLSAPTECRRSGRRCAITTDADPEDSPFAVFYFMYRSKEALQQELIIPRPRSLSLEADVDHLSAAELRRLARERLAQIRDENKRRASIKDENDEAPRSGRPHKLIKIEGGNEAIDLTEDD